MVDRKKVILISVDGMRPDGFLSCGNPYIQTIMDRAYYTLDARTVMPSITLPCHMSMFHSVPPSRHGVMTGSYTPPAHPVGGLFEQFEKAGRSCGMYYGWQPLRDVARPLSLKYSEYITAYAEENVDEYLTERALWRIRRSDPDMVFLYMVDTDEIGGHMYGWMTPEYLETISRAVDNIRRVIEECGEDHSIVITADHGGHDRTHGTEMPEDMTIPIFYMGPDFAAGTRFQGGSILDIAPTIAKIADIPAAPEWEGSPVF